MANYYNPSTHSLFIICLLMASVLLLSSHVLAKSRRPITDSETRQKKLDCYADIESGLWGQQCKSPMIAKENCALRCLSPACYELIYESDPLEEGEKDFVRSQEFKYCIHNVQSVLMFAKAVGKLLLWHSRMQYCSFHVALDLCIIK